MIRKPPLLYFVALWLLVQQAYYLKLPATWIAEGLGRTLPSTQAMGFVMAMPMVVVILALLRLQNWARWTAVGMFGVAMTVLASLLVSAASADTAPAPRVYVLLGVMAVVNGICILWLVRGDGAAAVRAAKQARTQGITE